MRIQELPNHRRPRERIISSGVDALEIQELIAVVLGSGNAKRSVIELSLDVERVITTTGVSIPRLAELPGIGQSKAALLCAAVELGRRLAQSDVRSIFAAPEDIFRACGDIIRLPQEHLLVFYLNIRNQTLERETISVGTVSSSMIHPREVFRSAISHSASSIILAHNHPSGSIEPSEADREATIRIARAGKELGIPLLDHVICSNRGFTSLKNRFPEIF